MQKIIAGVDEVGRGPLAGPVTAAAAILPADYDLPGLADSKKVSEKKRDILFDAIKEQAVSYAIAMASPEEIDEINILQASLLAMQRSVEGLSITPDKIEVDGIHEPKFDGEIQTIIGGDNLVPCIMAASILAKVARDRLMVAYENEYPGYGLAKHKGYPTAQHMQALNDLGITPIHRKSFKPVKRTMEKYANITTGVTE